MSEKTLKTTPMHYCPGCGHRIIHRILAETIDELDLREKVILLAPAGCAVLLYDYFNCDVVECAHGRAPAVATAIKRHNPDATVIAYQGDGDAASIGANELIHATRRNENITVIIANNALFAMTGGQVSATTPKGEKTTTTQSGNPDSPLMICELLKAVNPKAYIKRSGIHDPESTGKSKNFIREAIEHQHHEKGISVIDILSMCPTNWHKTPKDACLHIKDSMAKIYPLD